MNYCKIPIQMQLFMSNDGSLCLHVVDTLARRTIPCACYGSFKMFEVPVSEFGTMSMRRWFLFHAVSESVDHGVYKVITQSRHMFIRQLPKVS